MIQRSACVFFRLLSRAPAPPSSKARACYYGTQATSSLQEACESSIYSRTEDEYAGVDWDNLGFGLVQTDYMYMMRCGRDEEFKQGQLSRYGNIELSPSAGVLNYGQVHVLSGGDDRKLKHKGFQKDDGGLFLFRPQENAIRMQIGAQRMCMPCPSVEQFLDAVKQTALANRRWIPPAGKGSLYIRPLLMGSGSVLGLAPASEYTFLVYASPVGNYFKEGTAALNLYVEDEFHRAARGGAGGIKSITNYAPVLKAIARARDRGFSEILYLDSVNKRNIEEGNILSTPATNGTILAGVTRKSIIDIAHDLGYEVEERSIPIEELINADEVFCTGTAVGVAPVGSITYKGNRVEYKTSTQLVSQKLYSRLTGIQRGIIKDSQGWVVEID
ncbi:Branched-chain-amino-acid aminotransferase 2, chloroplastic [Sesamum angolense]|uniref:Branched-chain-amino-acid aminotransferase 2, chloroplastic n=1 Tax=Sesamum angolense TaxID=2727404 RepID=A0AAE2BM22_9LAMI|nr:Branched-chain-amino-acid aminotransferase 2, chloroplastic [Sesamum angolense]